VICPHIQNISIRIRGRKREEGEEKRAKKKLLNIISGNYFFI
jgi:hypothetical protein